MVGRRVSPLQEKGFFVGFFEGLLRGLLVGFIVGTLQERGFFVGSDVGVLQDFLVGALDGVKQVAVGGAVGVLIGREDGFTVRDDGAADGREVVDAVVGAGEGGVRDDGAADGREVVVAAVGAADREDVGRGVVGAGDGTDVVGADDGGIVSVRVFDTKRTRWLPASAM